MNLLILGDALKPWGEFLPLRRNVEDRYKNSQCPGHRTASVDRLRRREGSPFGDREGRRALTRPSTDRHVDGICPIESVRAPLHCSDAACHAGLGTVILLKAPHRLTRPGGLVELKLQLCR